MKAAVFIRKEWGSEIKVTVDDTEIAIQQSLDAFLHALVTEAKSPIMVVTKAGLEKLIKDAAEIVLTKMKQETAKVM